jgi:hypothetical protein
MAWTDGVPEGPGEFPYNLVGKEMIFWRLQKLPYPEELCQMWHEMWELSAWKHQDLGYWNTWSGRLADGPQGYSVIFNEVMGQLGLGGYEYDWYFSPVNYHAALRTERRGGKTYGTLDLTRKENNVMLAIQAGQAATLNQPVPKYRVPLKRYPKDNPQYTEAEAREFAESSDYPYQWPDGGGYCTCSRCTAATDWKKDQENAAKFKKQLAEFSEELANYPYVSPITGSGRDIKPPPPPFDLRLTPPNPPRIARLQVEERTEGQKTIHVLDYPLLYLKDAKDWKYDDTVTISVDDIDRLVDKLLAIKYRVQERRGE